MANSKPPSPIPSALLLLGALAGVVGAAAMTAAMERFNRMLPPSERYPMPPREVTAAVIGEEGEHGDEGGRDIAIAAHFAFGAACGGLLTAVNPKGRPLGAVLLGIGIWAGSYLGWIPALGLLKPAGQHPVRRNLVMIAAHVVWGFVTAATLRELSQARDGMFAGGPMADRRA